MQADEVYPTRCHNYLSINGVNQSVISNKLYPHTDTSGDLDGKAAQSTFCSKLLQMEIGETLEDSKIRLIT